MLYRFAISNFVCTGNIDLSKAKRYHAQFQQAPARLSIIHVGICLRSVGKCIQICRNRDMKSRVPAHRMKGTKGEPIALIAWPARWRLQALSKLPGFRETAGLSLAFAPDAGSSCTAPGVRHALASGEAKARTQPLL